MVRIALRNLVLILMLAVIFGTPISAQAKSRQVFNVSKERLWSTVLRYIQVDLKCKVDNKDKDSGFVIFQYKLNELQTTRATLEMYPDDQNDVNNPKYYLQIEIENVPAIKETKFFMGLRDKLDTEK